MKYSKPKIGYRRNSSKLFINPYNFVESPRFDEVKRTSALSSAGTHTGYFDCSMYVRTPLAIPDAEHRTEDRECSGHFIYPLFSLDGENPVIPGSSIRGMIRNIFETVTDSCMVTAKDGIDLSARTSSNKPYKPGLLIKEPSGEWSFFKAERVRAVTDNRATSEVICFRLTRRTDDFSYLTYKNQQFENGEKVYVTSTKASIGVGDVCDIRKADSGLSCPPKMKEGYVYIGEPIKNKRGESVFCKGEAIGTFSQPTIKHALDGLKRTLNIYRNDAINGLYDKKRFLGYPDFERLSNSNCIPVWYSYDEDTKKLYFSLASIGRHLYYNSLTDLVGEPCHERKSVCPACALFGMIGKNGQSIGSRVRFSDATMVHGSVIDKKVTLQELGQPRESYLPFHSIGNRSYDAEDGGIRGRKYYWHNKKAATSSFPYDNIELKTKRNATMDGLIAPESEFTFRVHYENLTEAELNRLAWALTLGENDSNGRECHKIGHGKPLGLGSVKITISREKSIERMFKDNTFELIQSAFDVSKAELNNNAKRELLVICDYERSLGAEIRYPYIYAEGGNVSDVDLGKNGKANHKWFTENNAPRKNNKPQLLSSVLEQNQCLETISPFYKEEDKKKRW